MPLTMSVEEAQGRLKEIIGGLAPGDEVILTENQRPVAKLVSQRKPRKAGSAKGKLIVLQEDDEHLKDFAEYMP